MISHLAADPIVKDSSALWMKKLNVAALTESGMTGTN